MSSRGQTNEAAGVRGGVRPVAMSVLTGMAVCMALLVIMSVVVTTQNIPQSAIDPMAIFAMSAGAFVSGYLCAGAMRANGLIYGAICGFVITVIVVVAGQFVDGGGLGIPALFRMAFVMLSAMIGGVIRVNTRRRKR